MNAVPKDGVRVCDDPGHERPSSTVDRPSTDREPTVAPDALLTSKDETITALRDEVAFLRRELETRTDELQRRDVLLREALERIPQLPANVTTPLQASPVVHHRPETTDATLSASRSWWQAWRRWWLGR